MFSPGTSRLSGRVSGRRAHRQHLSPICRCLSCLSVRLSHPPARLPLCPPAHPPVPATCVSVSTHPRPPTCAPVLEVGMCRPRARPQFTCRCRSPPAVTARVRTSFSQGGSPLSPTPFTGTSWEDEEQLTSAHSPQTSYRFSLTPAAPALAPALGTAPGARGCPSGGCRGEWGGQGRV